MATTALLAALLLLGACTTPAGPDPLAAAVGRSLGRFEASVERFTSQLAQRAPRKIAALQDDAAGLVRGVRRRTRASIFATTAFADELRRDAVTAPGGFRERGETLVQQTIRQTATLTRPTQLAAVRREYHGALPRARAAAQRLPHTLRLDRQVLAIPADVNHTVQVTPAEGGPNWLDRILYRLRL